MSPPPRSSSPPAMRRRRFPYVRPFHGFPVWLVWLVGVLVDVRGYGARRRRPFFSKKRCGVVLFRKRSFSKKLIQVEMADGRGTAACALHQPRPPPAHTPTTHTDHHTNTPHHPTSNHQLSHQPRTSTNTSTNHTNHRHHRQ